MAFKIYDRKPSSNCIYLDNIGRWLGETDDDGDSAEKIVSVLRRSEDEIFVFRSDGDAEFHSAMETFNERMATNSEFARKFRADMTIALLRKKLWDTARHYIFSCDRWLWFGDLESDGYSIALNRDEWGWTGLVIVAVRDWRFDDVSIDPVTYHLFWIHPDDIHF